MINEFCYYYDCGFTAPAEYGAFCTNHKCRPNSDKCENCEIKSKHLFYNYRKYRVNAFDLKSVFNKLHGKDTKCFVEHDKTTSLFAIKDMDEGVIYIINQRGSDFRSIYNN